MADPRPLPVIVIGAGHNGLAAAQTIARAAGRGTAVIVLEQAAQVGGMAAGGMLAGVAVPRLAHLVYALPSVLLKELRLERHGLALGPPLATVSLDPDGGRHTVAEGAELRLADGAAHPDAAAYRALWQRLIRYAAALAPMRLAPPPALLPTGSVRGRVSDGLGLARLGLALRRLGRVEMREFLRIVLSNLADLVLDEIADGPAAGALALDGLLGSAAGPRSPGTVLGLLYRLTDGGGRRVPMGGMGQLSDAFATAAKAAGVEIRTGVTVARIETDAQADRVTAVHLADGTRLEARLVLSSLDPHALLRLTGPAPFDAEMVRRLRHVRARGATAKLNLVLSGVPRIAGLSDALLRQRLVLAPSVAALEAAFNPTKYGRIGQAPALEMVLGPVAGGGSAQVASVVIQSVPTAPSGGGWTAPARERLMGAVLAQLERVAPGFGALVTASELLTPADIQDLTGAAGGHWHHGELAPDQLLSVRPVNGMARYATGIPGLYLCGAGAHPGGDLIGAAGRNGALAAVRDGALRLARPGPSHGAPLREHEPA